MEVIDRLRQRAKQAEETLEWRSLLSTSATASSDASPIDASLGCAMDLAQGVQQ